MSALAHLMEAIPLSPAELQARINQELSEKLTGQMRVTFYNGITLTFFVQQGRIRQLYIRNHRLPNLNWQYPLTRYGHGTLTIESMPTRAMHFKKIVLEELKAISFQPAGTSQLRTMFDLAEHNPGPTLFHVRWESTEAFVLVAGKSISLRYAVLLTQPMAKEGQVALDQISAWNETRCNIAIHHGDIVNQAWLEVHLNILFEWYCNRILNLYEQLTGNVMLQSILRRIYMLAMDEGWNIETQRRSLNDTSLFTDAGTAGRAYKRILLLIEHQIEPIIGSALKQKILKQAYDIPRDVYKNIAEVFEIIEDQSI